MRLFPFILIFLAVLEIMVFMWAGQYIGFWPTIGLVLLTAVTGSFLVRAQGMRALADFQRSAATGEGQVGLVIFTGLCLLLAGAFLITPGFITDAFGLILLTPPLRAGLYQGLKQHFQKFAGSQSFGFTAYGRSTGAGGGKTTIDVEGEEKP